MNIVKKSSISKEEAQARREKSLDVACKALLARWETRKLADLHLLIETEKFIEPTSQVERIGNAALEVIDKRTIAILLARKALWNDGRLEDKSMPEFGEKINLALAQIYEAVSELELDFAAKKAKTAFWHDFYQLCLDNRALLERDKAKRNTLIAEASHFYHPIEGNEEGGDGLW